MKAQLFQTREDIINEFGPEYGTGVTDEGNNYIFYHKKVRTDASGIYIQTQAIYFVKHADGTEVCYKWKIFEPSSETNSNVAQCKSKFVEIGDMRWKDYENSIIYDIYVEDETCIITSLGDKKK